MVNNHKLCGYLWWKIPPEICT